MRKFVMLAMVLGLSSASALAQTIEVLSSDQVFDLSGNPLGGGGGIASPGGSTYTVYTGLTNSANQLFLIEPTAPPVRDDIVTYDGAAELINDYVPAAGSVQRTVVETKQVAADIVTLSITVTGTGELAPTGFTGGGLALDGIGVGLGLNLGAALGNDPLDWLPGPNIVQSATLSFVAGTAYGPFNITGLFNPAGWNGVTGVRISNTAGRNTTEVRWDFVIRKTPEPTALALIGLGALALLRRR